MHLPYKIVQFFASKNESAIEQKILSFFDAHKLDNFIRYTIL